MNRPDNRHKPDQELTIISKAKDLVNETLHRTAKFPKRVRFNISNRMDDLALGILRDIITANEINPDQEPDPALKRAAQRQRNALQTQALTGCKVLLNFMDIALEQQLIDQRVAEYWTKRVLDVKYMAAAWRKKDAARFR
ncbi:four helix bundle protein [uncultured Dysosmobacter sp.]|uniref:four helix bundle protein n=1 Tax=uncultured Dysosmobacter sp. TaxID=2591384 RepID=UPI002602F0F1|nr:four helix bundle protein [uncultured Dysosmobacter sp.]